ncbi:MAG TPA: hypothetical protein VJX74_16135 [Blastocatellia bacterium]|nr:hypothetical protein [Blastocatellia bacterium]
MSTLTCNLTAVDEHIRIAAIWDGAGSSGNKLWRRADDENNGQFILLTDALELAGYLVDVSGDPLLDVDGDPLLAESAGLAFHDYDVASNKDYSYYIEISSTGQASAIESASVSLHSAYLHAVTKYSGISNLRAGAALGDQSHARRFSFASSLQIPANSVLPVVRLSPIEEGSISMATIIPQQFDSRRASLRSVYTSRAMCCLRDAFGNKWFGRLADFKEVPQGLHFLFNFSLEILDFNESLA